MKYVKLIINFFINGNVSNEQFSLLFQPFYLKSKV